MSHRTLVVDGLWYTLCPSFSPAVLSRYAPSLRLRHQSPGRCLAQPLSSTAALYRRFYSSDARKEHDDENLNKSPTHVNWYYRPSPATDTPFSPGEESENRQSNGVSSRRANEPFKQSRTSSTPEHLQHKSEEWLERNLQYRVVKNPSIRGATEILRALIRDHGVKPKARHYKALILAHSDNERGSPDVVRSLLEEMEKNGIAADSGTLHAVLQVSIPLRYVHIVPVGCHSLTF